MINETQIEKLLKQRDVAAFGWVYDKYAPTLYGVILSLTTDSILADEILRKSFIKVWRTIDSFNSVNGGLFTWMLGVTLRECTDELSLSNKALLEKYTKSKTALPSLARRFESSN